jgi:hypothetical protein
LKTALPEEQHKDISELLKNLEKTDEGDIFSQETFYVTEDIYP